MNEHNIVQCAFISSAIAVLVPCISWPDTSAQEQWMRRQISITMPSTSLVTPTLPLPSVAIQMYWCIGCQLLHWVRRERVRELHPHLFSPIGEGPQFTLGTEEVEGHAVHCNKNKKDAKTADVSFQNYLQQLAPLRCRVTLCYLLPTTDCYLLSPLAGIEWSAVPWSTHKGTVCVWALLSDHVSSFSSLSPVGMCPPHSAGDGDQFAGQVV